MKSLNLSLDYIVKRERCVGFVCVTFIYVIKVVKDGFKLRIKLACSHPAKCLGIKLFCNNGLRASKERVGLFLGIIICQQCNVFNTSSLSVSLHIM